MKKIINDELIENLIKTALEAGGTIMQFYKTDMEINSKDDASPVTAADIAAHEIIERDLGQLTPDIPIVSEEGDNRDSGTDYFWLVDPLDGTKSFIKHTDDFTVNIALIDKDTPILGVVYAPALDELYYTGADGGCYFVKNGISSQIKVRNKPEDGLEVVASRSHSSPETEEFISRIKVKGRINIGSSLKFCLVASGRADCYPRLGPTMEWDTAAAHAVVLAAGGTVVTQDNNPLKYGKDSFKNPYFIVWGG